MSRHKLNVINSELRDYQVEVIRKIYREISDGKKRILARMPCGAGKTKMALNIMLQAFNSKQKDGKQVGFCFPYLSLRDQTITEALNEGFNIEDIGVMQHDHHMRDDNKPVQLISERTLSSKTARNKNKVEKAFHHLHNFYPDFFLLIIDECHLLSEFYREWMNHRPNMIVVGITATPYAPFLGKLFQSYVQGPTTLDMIEWGFNPPVRIFACPAPDMSDVKIISGDYAKNGTEKKYNNIVLIGDVINNYIAHGDNKQALVYCSTCSQAKFYANHLREKGFSTDYQDAHTSDEERSQIAHRWRLKKTRFIVSVDTMTIGLDLPNVHCIIFLRPTKSKTVAQQILGRGMRIEEGKKDLLVFDHTTTTKDLGYFTYFDSEFTSLNKDEKGKRTSSKSKKSEPSLECPKCHFIRPPKTHKCPECGFEPEIQPVITQVEEELKQLTGGNLPSSRAYQQMLYSWLIRYTFQKDYDIGFAYHMLKKMISGRHVISNLVKKPSDGPVPDFVVKFIDDQNNSFKKNQRTKFIRKQYAIRSDQLKEQTSLRSQVQKQLDYANRINLIDL